MTVAPSVAGMAEPSPFPTFCGGPETFQGDRAAAAHCGSPAGELSALSAMGKSRRAGSTTVVLTARGRGATEGRTAEFAPDGYRAIAAA
jgi:hypothetical protein